jgi:RNase P/RNase MRP subunit POP5
MENTLFTELTNFEASSVLGGSESRYNEERIALALANRVANFPVRIADIDIAGTVREATTEATIIENEDGVSSSRSGSSFSIAEA